MAGLVVDPWVSQVMAAMKANVVLDLDFSKRFLIEPGGAGVTITSVWSLSKQAFSLDTRVGTAVMTNIGSPTWEHNTFNGSIGDCMPTVASSIQMDASAENAPLFNLMTGAAKPKTMFFVFKTDVALVEQIMCSFGNTGTPEIFFDQGGFGTGGSTGAWVVNGNVPGAGTDVIGTVPHVDCLSSDGTTMTCYRDGTSVGTCPDAAMTINRFKVGGFVQTGTFDRYTGRFARIIIFDKQLDTANRNTIIRQLGRKYGITVA